MFPRLSVFFLLVLLSLPLRAYVSGLNARDFDRYWRVEAEDSATRVSFMGDTADIVAPKGLTLWRRQKMEGDLIIEYDACVVDGGQAGDRLSDLNCFWMASDPKHPDDIFARAGWRHGIFANSYSLQLYYVGYGGNHNTTTRFRRYDGNEDAIAQAEKRPAILREYTDADHLLKANHWYHVKLINKDSRVQYYIDGQLLVDYRDPAPLREGWFGFRTTLSHTRLTHFTVRQNCTCDGVGVEWIGGRASADATCQTFGVPFKAGKLRDTRQLTLATDDGTQVDADCWPLATWPDGSVKWTAVSTVVPAGTQALKLLNKKPKTVAAPIAVDERQGQIVVSTGSITAYIPTHGTCLMDSLLLRGVKTVAGLTVTGRRNRRYHAVVERRGRVSAVVKVESENADDDAFGHLTRLYFHARSEEVRVVHTLVCRTDGQTPVEDSLGLTLLVPLREQVYNRHVAFATDDGGIWTEPVQPLTGRAVNKRTQALFAKQMDGRHVTAEDLDGDERLKSWAGEWAAWDGFRLSQTTDMGFTVRKRATCRSPWIGTFAGRRAPGYFFLGDTSGGVGVWLKDFWQSYPSTLQVDDARSREARMTVYLWSPEAERMDLRHYDERPHGLAASYEDVQPQMSTPRGIARTSVLVIRPEECWQGKVAASRLAQRLTDDLRLAPSPQYLHDVGAFGVWSLPDRTSVQRERVEQRLDTIVDFYLLAADQHHWYGFWNYGDVMHQYDDVRHTWRYDVGGYAWDNTELASPEWLWYTFLRTGRKDVFRMAEAMTRHCSEVDVYHEGPYAGLGSRHNVSHWGDGAKEARISQAAFNRFYYYLTADERTGDLMTAVRDADTLLLHVDPMRLAEPREKYPCKAPARLRIGPDWLAYAGNWMTEWERTGNKHYRDKIVAGMKSISSLPDGLFTGNKALGYDPRTGIVSYDGVPGRQNTNHLMTIMGGFELMNELSGLVSVPAFEKVWLDHAVHYQQKAETLSRNSFPVRRLMAFAAWKTGDVQLARQAWWSLWNRIEHKAVPHYSYVHVSPPDAPAHTDELRGMTTNDAALWSLDAIYMQEVIPLASDN